MSVTYKVASQASIERAVKKAQQVKPHVKVNGYNDFTVTGSKGDAYQVHFTGKGADFTAHCTCTGSTNGRVCYHAVSAALVFKLQINERTAQAAPVLYHAEPAFTPGNTFNCYKCGKPFTMTTGRETMCMPCAEEASRRFADLLDPLPDFSGEASLDMCKTCHMAPASINGECERCYEEVIYG